MRDQELIGRWLGAFPELTKLDAEHQAEMLAAIHFKRLREGDVAYYQGQPCDPMSCASPVGREFSKPPSRVAQFCSARSTQVRLAS